MDNIKFDESFLFNVLICEDEAVSLRVNETYIRELSRRNQVNPNIYCCDTTKSNPVEIMKKAKIDIAFMDIQLKEKNGIYLARKFLQCNPDMAIIYITNYTEYSMDAFRMKAFGYVQKPIVQEDLERYYVRAITYIWGLAKRNNEAVLRFIYNRENISIYQRNIIYLEKVQRKVDIVTTTKKFSPYISISDLEQMLCSDFIKINQGTLINKKEVLFHDSKTVTMSTGDSFSIGRLYRKKRII